MVLDVVDPVLQVAVPLAQVVDQQMLHQGLGVVVESLGEVQFPLEDILVDDERIIVGEGVNPGDHLVDQHTQGPPVDWLAVALVLQDLGGQVFGCSTEGKGSIFYGLSKSKICKFEISIWSDENVLRFEVTVDDVLGVEVLEDEDDVAGVEAE